MVSEQFAELRNCRMRLWNRLAPHRLRGFPPKRLSDASSAPFDWTRAVRLEARNSADAAPFLFLPPAGGQASRSSQMAGTQSGDNLIGQANRRNAGNPLHKCWAHPRQCEAFTTYVALARHICEAATPTRHISLWNTIQSRFCEASRDGLSQQSAHQFDIDREFADMRGAAVLRAVLRLAMQFLESIERVAVHTAVADFRDRLVPPLSRAKSSALRTAIASEPSNAARICPSLGS